MLKGLKRQAVIVLLVNIIVAASLPLASAEFEFRREVRAGDLQFSNQITIVPIFRTIFHSETLAAADT